MLSSSQRPQDGVPPYCGHGWTFRHGWFAHFYTKSRQEFEEKNARGDAFFASRKKVGGELPTALGAMHLVIPRKDSRGRGGFFYTSSL